MNKKIQIITALFVLLFASLACSTQVGTPTPTLNQVDELGTIVALTQTALALPQASTVATEMLPTDTPNLPAEPPILRVVYIKNLNAYIWTQAGGSVQLTSTNDVRDVKISLDGQMVAFTRNPASFVEEVWAVNNDGTNLRLLVSSAELVATYSGNPADMPSGIGVYQFGWQPGTHNLYYNTRPLFEGPGYGSYDDLYSVNSDSLTKTQVFPAHAGGKFFFSPNGNLMAIVTSTGINLSNADGSNLHSGLLSYPGVITYSEYSYYPRPVWAPDSRGLRVVIPPGDPLASPLPSSNLWYLPGDGSAATMVGSILAIPFDWPDYAISPDLSLIGYVSPVGVPSANLRDMHIANADTSGDVVFLGSEQSTFEGWLPNSTQFVFKVSSGAAQGVHVGTVGGGYVTLSTDPVSMSNITWPESTHYLFLLHNSGITELRYNLLGGSGSLMLDSGDISSYDFSN
jgi:hypothetical protein